MHLFGCRERREFRSLTLSGWRVCTFASNIDIVASCLLVIMIMVIIEDACRLLLKLDVGSDAAAAQIGGAIVAVCRNQCVD